MQSLQERIRVLEEKWENGEFRVAAGPQNTPAEEEDYEPPVMPKALTEDIKKIVSNWTGILRQMPPGCATMMKTAKLTAKEDDKLLIVVADSMLCNYLNKDMQRAQIADSLAKAIGKEVDFDVIALEEGKTFNREFVDLSKMIQMEVETEA